MINQYQLKIEKGDYASGNGLGVFTDDRLIKISALCDSGYSAGEIVMPIEDFLRKIEAAAEPTAAAEAVIEAADALVQRLLEGDSIDSALSTLQDAVLRLRSQNS